MAKKYFTLVVLALLMATGVARAQVCDGSCVVGVTVIGEVGLASGTSIISWNNLESSDPSITGNTISDDSGVDVESSVSMDGNPQEVPGNTPSAGAIGDGIAAFAMGVQNMMVGNASSNLANAQQGNLQPLGYIMAGPSGATEVAGEDGSTFYLSGSIRGRIPYKSMWGAEIDIATEIKSVRSAGSFQGKYLAWGRGRWQGWGGSNFHVPGNHFLKSLSSWADSLDSNMNGPAQRALNRFYSNEMPLQNAIRREASLVQYYNKMAEQPMNSQYGLLMTEDAEQHYIENGLWAFPK